MYCSHHLTKSLFLKKYAYIATISRCTSFLSYSSNLPKSHSSHCSLHRAVWRFQLTSMPFFRVHIFLRIFVNTRTTTHARLPSVFPPVYVIRQGRAFSFLTETECGVCTGLHFGESSSGRIVTVDDTDSQFLGSAFTIKCTSFSLGGVYV